MEYSLTTNEYNALQHITSLNKMDCWFSIRQTKHGEDYIYDLEERKRISLTKTLNDIYDGLLKEDFDLLDKEEQKALNGLFKRYLKKELGVN